MDLGQLDAATRVAGVTMILLLAWLSFRQRREIGVPAWLFPPLAICLSGFLIGNTPDASLRLSGAPAAAAHFASGCAVVFLWWFCLACFDRRFRPGRGMLAVAACWIGLAVFDRITPQDIPAVSYALLSLGFAIVAHLVWTLVTDRDGDLIQQRHSARTTVALLLGGLLLVDLSADLVFGFAWRPAPFAIGQNAVILGFALWLAGKMLSARPEVLSFERRPAAAAAATAPMTASDERPDEELRRRLTALIEVERIHLDPDLTFATFVRRMNAPERTVRRLVNHELGFDHFRSFLNHYRVQEARRLLADPGRSGDKLIATAFDSGFSSLPSFNRAFRAAAACTPSQYRQAALVRAAEGA